MRAQIIAIGDEVLIGQIRDTNSHWMASFLNENGVRVERFNVVSDKAEAIAEAIENCEKSGVQVVFVTGGLGPTKDDITKKTVADYFGMELVFHEPSWTNLVKLFAKYGRKVTDDFKWQCNMPQGATILINPVGTASGMWFQRDNFVVVSMPGVPHEMKHLMENQVVTLLKDRFKSSPILHHVIMTYGIGETTLSNLLEDFENNLPPHLKLAYLPYLGGVRLRLTGKADDEARLKQDLTIKGAELQELVKKYAFGEGDTPLEEYLAQLLVKKKLTLATAESCTGGLISNMLVTRPGASLYFQGSVVAYTNDAKNKVLGVSYQTLDQFGAVSEQTVLQMATNVLKVLNAKIAVAVSGISGPGGGSPDKPVGTVCIAIADNTRSQAFTVRFGKERAQNMELTANSALYALIQFVETHY